MHRPEGEEAEEAVRRGVGTQGSRRQDRRSARSADRRRRRAKSRSGIRSFPTDECRRVGAQIAVAAIRYFMLKFSRGKLIVFDIEEALSFEGETGPYLQYAVVRANNIFHKLQEREGLTEADVARGARRDAAGRAAERATTRQRTPLGARLRGVAPRRGRRTGGAVARVLRCWRSTRSGWRRLFNAFYHRYPILNEERADRKRWRAAGVAYVRAQLTRALDLMGIDSSRSTDVDRYGRCHWHHARCRKLEDYQQAILHVGGEVRDPRAVDAASTRRWPASTACC